MKRVLHYLILAAVLVGLPLASCLLWGSDEIIEGVRQFPPRTEDWGFHPEKLWNVRRPFNIWWFSGLLAFTVACVFPLVRRGLRSLRRDPPKRTALRHPFPWWGWAGGVVLAVSWVVTWSRFPCFTPFQQAVLSYFPIWTGYILVMNALTVRRSGRSPLTDHPALYLCTFPASSLFWWFFEYLNRYVWNWYYRGIDNFTAGEYTFYATVCFASVLPAVYATAEFLGTFAFFEDRRYEGMAWRPNVRSPLACVLLTLLSAVGLVGIVLCPDCVYPFLWISPLMVFVLVQVALKEPCLLDELRHGAWGRLFRFSTAALCCGLCWETWNYYAMAKWVYAVPWVHVLQVWEMPVLGFAGYLPFGAECAAVIAWIYGKRAT